MFSCLYLHLNKGPFTFISKYNSDLVSTLTWNKLLFLYILYSFITLYNKTILHSNTHGLETQIYSEHTPTHIPLSSNYKFQLLVVDFNQILGYKLGGNRTPDLSGNRTLDLSEDSIPVNILSVIWVGEYSECIAGVAGSIPAQLYSCNPWVFGCKLFWLYKVMKYIWY